MGQRAKNSSWRQSLGCASLSLTILLASLGGITDAATICNGNAGLCAQPYSNVSFVGAHDSAFYSNPGLLVDNQHVSVTQQLALGIRFLQTQTHDKDGTIENCHTSCAERDGGTLASYLALIKTFLDGNANEVVTLLLTNGDAIAPSAFAALFKDAGLEAYAYTPGKQLALGDWPTLSEMIDSGRRLVTFMDYHADTTAVPYILDEFAYYFETPYDTTDSSFPECNLDRPAGASPDGRMYIVNHFLDIDILGIYIPNQAAAATTNSLSSIMAQANLCEQKWGRKPSVVLLDWVDKGDPIGAQSSLNGI